jgi:hypothetical protein
MLRFSSQSGIMCLEEVTIKMQADLDNLQEHLNGLGSVRKRLESLRFH